MFHKLGALLCGVPKYIAKLALNLSLPLTSITGSALLPIWMILLPMPTLLLLEAAAVTSNRRSTILRWRVHIPQPIPSTSAPLKG
jgi:hypothetical protein